MRIDDRIEDSLVPAGSRQHHSTDDWDYYSALWTLDVVNFVSAPSSLKLTTPTNYATLKDAVSGVITEGRIVDFFRFYRGRHTTVLFTYQFRCQTPDGATLPNSRYYVSLLGSTSITDQPIDTMKVSRVVAGGHTVIATRTLNPTLEQEVWHKLRVTWWESGGVLMVRLEKLVGAEWTALCEDVPDITNMWSESGINRVGVGMPSVKSDFLGWHDDTEIWTKAV